MYGTLYQLHVSCEEITVGKKEQTIIRNRLCQEIYNYRGNTHWMNHDNLQKLEISRSNASGPLIEELQLFHLFSRLTDR